MASPPLLSFIVLSYNYENYIRQTIRSILDQSVQDFEIVVVDDASTDASREAVAAFGDPRIRLLVNERNRGGAGSYNRAVSEARGEWLVNLDADDWIAPGKSAAQLQVLARDPTIDIIATHIGVVDADGNPHPQRDEMEGYVNRDIDLNCIEAWLGRNAICRSSTMVRRAAHLRIGLDDPMMTRAPDYELWTRALHQGCRFARLRETLTFYRLHAKGVTYADSHGTFLELSYAMHRNLVPLAEARGLWPSFGRILAWVAEHEELAGLTPRERYRLLGSILLRRSAADYADFLAQLHVEDTDSPITAVGRRCLAVLRANPLLPALEKLERDNDAYIGARNWWHDQADRREESANQAAADARAWHEQADCWEKRADQAAADARAMQSSAAWRVATVVQDAARRYPRIARPARRIARALWRS